MLNRTILTILIYIAGLAAGPYGELYHTPVKYYKTRDTFEVKVLYSGLNSEISRMTLMMRQLGYLSFTEIPMSFESIEWVASVAPSELAGGGVEYFILAETINGGAISYPANSPLEKPLFVEDLSPKKTASALQPALDLSSGDVGNELLILSPEPGVTVEIGKLVIAISLFNVPDADLSTTRILVDKQDLTKLAEITPELITMTPPLKLIPAGTHTITVQMANQFGAVFKPLQWSFNIVEELNEATQIFGSNGKVTLEYRNETVQNIQTEVYRSKVRFDGEVSDVKFGVNVNWVSNDDPSYQPRSIYSLFVDSDYLNLSLGDFNPMFSKLGLWGNRVRGYNIHLKLGFFNLQFIRGQLLRPVTGLVTYTDSTSTYEMRNYTYGQNVIGIKPAIGSGERAQFYFSFIQSRDDTTSLYTSKIIPEFDPLVHTLNRLGSSPQDNLVFGVGNSLNLDGHRFYWEQELSFSITNRDISIGTMDSLTVGDTTLVFSEVMKAIGLKLTADQLSALLIINENTSLPIPAELDENYELRISPLRFGKYPSLAYTTSLQLNYYNNYITVDYRRIAPEYASLANPGLTNDQKIVDLSDRIRLFSNKLFVNLKYSSQRDNLLEGVKEYTTDSKNTSIGLSLMPGGDLPFANISLRVYTSLNNATVVDTFRSAIMDDEGNLINYITYSDPRTDNRTVLQMFTLSQPVTFVGRRTDANLNVMVSRREDLIPNRPPGYINNDIYMLIWNVAFVTKWKPTQRFTASYSASNNETGQSSRYLYNIYSLKAVQKLFKNDLELMANLKYTTAWGTTDYVQYSANSEVKYQRGGNQFYFTLLFNKIYLVDSRSGNLKFVGRYVYSF